MQFRVFAISFGHLAISLALVSTSAKVWHVDDHIPSALGKSSAVSSSQAVASILTQVRPGDLIRLSDKVPMGTIHLDRSIPDIMLLGGFDGKVVASADLREWKFYYAGQGASFEALESANLEDAYFFASFSGGFTDRSPGNHYVFHGGGLLGKVGTIASLAKGSAEPTSTPGMKDQSPYKITQMGDKVYWMMRTYNVGSGIGALLQNGNGGRWDFAIEASQGRKVVSLQIEDSKRVQAYSGSSEGNNPNGAVYVVKNGEEVVLGMRRLFSNHRLGSEWRGMPSMGLHMTDGKNNVLHNHIGIADPTHASLRTEREDGLQLWQTFFEDNALNVSKKRTFQFATTFNGMRALPQGFTEPPLVEAEVVLGYSQDSILPGNYENLVTGSGDVPDPPAYEFQPWQNRKPIWETQAAPKQAGKMSAASRLSTDASFGSMLLAAGADPTGQIASDEAFEKLLGTVSTLEIGEGTFRITRPLRPFALGKALGKGSAAGRIYATKIMGKGPGLSKIVGSADQEVVLDLTGEGPESVQHIIVDGVAIDGGQTGVRIPEYGPVIIMRDFTIKGLGKAGIAVAVDAWRSLGKEGSCDPRDKSGDGNCTDEHLYEDGEIDGYDYGIHFADFCDKQGFNNVTFKNQKVAGISVTNTNVIHIWVKACRFENINGPGVDLSRGFGSAQYGYRVGYVNMIEGSQFINCGSATRASLDLGYNEISMVANTIIRGDKQVKYGFLGSPSTISNVYIDVNATKTPLALRNPRATVYTRSPGVMVHTVKLAKGKAIFAGGFPKGDGGPSDRIEDDYTYTDQMTNAGFNGNSHGGLKWWIPGQYDWAMPILIYQSDLGEGQIGYELRNLHGYKKDLITGTIGVVAPGTFPRNVPTSTVDYVNLKGQRVGAKPVDQSKNMWVPVDRR